MTIVNFCWRTDGLVHVLGLWHLWRKHFRTWQRIQAPKQMMVEGSTALGSEKILVLILAPPTTSYMASGTLLHLSGSQLSHVESMGWSMVYLPDL